MIILKVPFEIPVKNIDPNDPIEFGEFVSVCKDCVGRHRNGEPIFGVASEDIVNTGWMILNTGLVVKAKFHKTYKPVFGDEVCLDRSRKYFCQYEGSIVGMVISESEVFLYPYHRHNINSISSLNLL